MIRYINVEPHEVRASLKLDNDSPPIIGTGTQHVEYDIPNSELNHGAWCYVEADGYVTQVIRVLITDNPQLIDASTGQGLDVVLAPAIVELPRLRVRDAFFEQDNGQRFTAIETSDFNLFGRYLNGEDITPILGDRNGFNMHRVWMRYDLSQYGIGTCTYAQHPNLYDEISPFCQLLAKYGRYVEFTAYTGKEDYDPKHWDRLREILPSITNVIVELVNENDQSGNHIDPLAFTPINGVLCSHGSNGSQVPPVKPYWDYITFHLNDAPEWWRKNHNGMESWNGPTLTNEITRCWDNDAWPDHYEDSGACGTLLIAGSCFHSGLRNIPSGGKASIIFDDVQRTCANAHIEGCNSIDLAYQDGRYVHRTDLEGDTFLRVYGRRLDNGLEQDVYIRK